MKRKGSAGQGAGPFQFVHAQRVLTVLLAISLGAGQAQAYRPFDSTDASVPPPGEFELELGPLGLIDQGGRRTLVAPKVIVNLGILPNWEIVLEGRHLVALGRRMDQASYSLADTGAFLKGVVRPGSLQGGQGPSVGVEVGALLPTVNGDPGVGAAGLLIASHRAPALTIHLNGVAAYTRTPEWALSSGLIVEGPSSWVVRPVAETVFEQVVGGERLVSGLVGVIWRASEALVLDVAGRGARSGGANLWEVRAGLTWFTQLWRSE